MDMRYSREELVAKIDAISSEVLGAAYADADGWSEDHISLLLLDALNALNSSTLWISGDLEIPLRFDAYKQRGNDEKLRGDVAIVVARADGDYGFVGTAFLEMKKRSEDSGKFRSLDTEQLARIAANEPGSVVGFYDYLPEPYSAAPMPYDQFNVGILPARQVVCNVGRQEQLLRHATTLGHQFVYRYLEGADIDPAAGAAEAIALARRSKYVARFEASNVPQITLELLRRELARYDAVIDVISRIRLDGGGLKKPGFPLL